MKHFLILLCVALALGACKKSKSHKEAKSFEKILEEATGEAYKIAKLYTEDSDYVVYKNQVTGEYVAYNMRKFEKNNMKTLDQYLAVAIPGTDIVHNLERTDYYVESGYWEDIYESRWVDSYSYDSFCDCYVNNGYYESYWVGQRWVDNSYWTAYYSKGGFLFDNTSARSKDLELIAAMDESAGEKYVSSKLKSQFSLSTNRADELAKTLTRYQKLENVRELTDSEKNLFAKDAFGVSMAEFEKAVKDKGLGREESYKKLLEKAAETNQTTPEKIGSFFDEYVTASDVE